MLLICERPSSELGPAMTPHIHCDNVKRVRNQVDDRRKVFETTEAAMQQDYWMTLRCPGSLIVNTRVFEIKEFTTLMVKHSFLLSPNTRIKPRREAASA